MLLCYFRVKFHTLQSEARLKPAIARLHPCSALELHPCGRSGNRSGLSMGSAKQRQQIMAKACLSAACRPVQDQCCTWWPLLVFAPNCAPVMPNLERIHPGGCRQQQPRWGCPGTACACCSLGSAARGELTGRDVSLSR